MFFHVPGTFDATTLMACKTFSINSFSECFSSNPTLTALKEIKKCYKENILKLREIPRKTYLGIFLQQDIFL